MVHILSLLSLLNAAHTLLRKRHYRLFETSIDAVPSTPSAHRVKVDSSPLSSSPLRFIANMLLPQESAESRAHPDAAHDVWELAVWDPTPLSLRLFCLFSPGHVLLYWLFLPTTLSDPRPIITVVTTIFLSILLSLQLILLRSNFSQQIKDTAVVSKEVFHEYDTKYVHPRTRPLMRDVGTQYSDPSIPLSPSSLSLPHQTHHGKRRKSNIVAGGSPSVNHVETYTPKVIINRGFQTRPNINYRSSLGKGASLASDTTPSRGPPVASNSIHITTPLQQRDASSPIRPPSSALQHQPQPQLRPNGVLQQPSAIGGGGGGGSLGVYSHMQSPLRRPAPNHFPIRDGSMSPRKREGSPLKRGASSGMGFGGGGNGAVNGYAGAGGRRSGYY